MRSFKTVQISDDATKRFQDNVRDAVEPLLRLPLNDGVLLENLTLVPGSDNQVNHKLGRVPRAWLVVDRRQNASVWRTGWTNSLLTLQVDADCVVSLWVS